MTTELGNISLLNENQSLISLNEIQEHRSYASPTTAKISIIAGLILGVSLIALPPAIPYAFSIRGAAICIGIGAGIVGGLAAVIMATCVSLILSKALPNTHDSRLKR